jgi:hypothetical protein
MEGRFLAEQGITRIALSLDTVAVQLLGSGCAAPPALPPAHSIVPQPAAALA